MTFYNTEQITLSQSTNTNNHLHSILLQATVLLTNSKPATTTKNRNQLKARAKNQMKSNEKCFSICNNK